MDSRKIDALVAEHVMDFPFPRISWEGEEPILWIGRDPTDVPNYSTDIAAAWGVLDSIDCDDIKIDGNAVTLIYHQPQDDGPEWIPDKEFTATLGIDLTYENTGQAFAKAICLAALKAKGVEVD